MCRVKPSGWVSRSSTFMGVPGGTLATHGMSVTASQPAPRFMRSRFQSASSSSAGIGSCACSNWDIAAFACVSARIAERRRTVRRGIPRLDHGGVAHGERSFELLQPRYQQFAAGIGSAALDETHVPLRDAHPHGEFELAHAPRLAGLAQGFRQRRGRAVHGRIEPQVRGDSMTLEVIAVITCPADTARTPGTGA